MSVSFKAFAISMCVEVMKKFNLVTRFMLFEIILFLYVRVRQRYKPNVGVENINLHL